MKNHSSKVTKNISVAFAAFLISSNAFSKSTVDSEFELQLPRQFQQSLIDQKWKSLSTKEFQANWQLSDQIIQTSEVPVEIKGITLAVKTHLKKPALADSQALLQLESQDLSAEIKIAEVSVDTVIEKEIGGMIGKFRIQAKCENVVLDLKSGQGSFGMTLVPAVASSEVGGKVQDLSLSWNAGSWNIGDVTCSGAEGFDTVLKSEIQKISDDSKSFVDPQKENLKTQIAQYLSTYDIDVSLPRELVSSRTDIATSLYIDSYTEDATTQAMVAKGRIHIEFKNSKTAAAKSLVLSSTAVVLNQGTEAGLKLPADFVKTVMAEAYSADSWVHTLGSSKLPGFSTIMNSRFIQFFIWPELMNYSKSAEFKFDLYSNKDPQITGTGLSYGVKLNLLSRMQAPKGNNYVNFMSFTMPFTTQLNLAVSSGVMQIGFNSPTLEMTPFWDSSYVAKYSPSTRFSRNTIRKRILSSISGQTVNMTLPTLPLMEGVALKVQSAKSLSNGDLLLRLTP